MGFSQVVVLSLIMFFTTFLLGMLPMLLSRTLSQKHFRQLSIFSVGLLVGAALTVVIPEGIEAVYGSGSIRIPCVPRNEGGLVTHHAEGDHGEEPARNSSIGLALITGFMLMFLIDQLSTAHSQPNTHPNRLSIGSVLLSKHQGERTTRLLLPDARQNEDDLHISTAGSRGGPTPNSISSPTRTLPTTIGLVIHSLADGIALGASSSYAQSPKNIRPTSKLSMDLVIFLAIMVHKAPAAFGLVAYLMSEGVSKSSVRKILMAFSLAAPLGALITFIALNSSNKPNQRLEHQETMHWWTGMALLFSGGTFLFVATHALQENETTPVDLCTKLQTRSPSNDRIRPSSSVSNQDHVSNSTLKPTVGKPLTCSLMIFGMITPWFLTLIVGHHH